MLKNNASYPIHTKPFEKMKKNFKLLWGITLIGLVAISFTSQQSISERRTAFWYGWTNTCFPGNDWGKTTYITCGINYPNFKASNSATYNSMKALNSNEVKLQEVVESGATSPIKLSISKGTSFFKIVPKGNNINSASVYYLSEKTLNNIKKQPAKLEQLLALPLSSVNANYDVFKITYKGEKGYVFQSKIAHTEQYATATPDEKYTTSGGGMQTLILDNTDANKWQKATAKMSEINPNVLPNIGHQ